ncbi:hypothetical protein [Rhodopirellula sp. MGV]|uniref:hypothetical protein n=1 Tax=Rhodopirellula sp. MGV TaxID=2023130 RepID=UPI000B977FB3|nr:hypothetical protein [Rhodopirellula sp. MGV]OYP32247.1 hypothetical protein CGZ80_19425 [Rhodopirellula sp. MGV]PNY35971.1 hypothetical protein C2E31_16055 [Rhodopirellula baltica]
MASAQAQQHLPIADPFEFEPDFRWFEPIYDADLADMKPSKRANTGWFATYDRLYLYGSRPETNDVTFGEADTRLDHGAGHRYELGFMLPDADTGYLFSWVKNDVGAFFRQRHERANRLNEDEQPDLNAGATNPSSPFGYEAIPGVGNNLGFHYRFVDELDSLNVVSFDSYELSKTWRMEPYHYGGILEPMVGLRWFRIKDTYAASNFVSSNDPEQILVPTLETNFGNGAEQLTINQAFTENEALTAQLGFRYFKYINRFMVSGDFRVFSGGNWQSSYKNRWTETVVYDTTAPITQGAGIDRILREATPEVHSRNEEFFLGFDVRGDLAYQLTRDFTVRCGFQLIDIERGLWRGGDGEGGTVPGGDNDQDYLMVGYTFGLTLNR